MFYTTIKYKHEYIIDVLDIIHCKLRLTNDFHLKLYMTKVVIYPMNDHTLEK